MRVKRTLLSMATGFALLGAAGFAAASIASGGGFAALTRTTDTVGSTGGTGSTAVSRKVTLCHGTHSKKHPGVTITVGAAAVPAHVRHGDTLGACAVTAKTHGEHGETTTTTTTSTQSASAADDDNESDDDAHGGSHGNDGSRGHGHG